MHVFFDQNVNIFHFNFYFTVYNHFTFFTKEKNFPFYQQYININTFSEKTYFAN